MLPLLLAACMIPQAVDPVPDTGVDFVPDPAWSEPGRVQVATFNADWLWDHVGGEYEPRTEVDFQMIGRLLVEHDLELVGLQEVDGDGGMEMLQLPAGWDWVTGETGWSQNIALLWQTDAFEVSNVREVWLPGTDWPSKDPLVARVQHRGGNLRFTVVVVHFNPYEDYDDAIYRAMQVEELHTWLTDVLPTEEPSPWSDHVLVMGDFNDTFGGINRGVDSLEPLEQDPTWTFATWDTDDYTHIPYKSRIDHIMLSDDLLPRYLEAGQPDGCKVIAHDQLPPWDRYDGGWGGDQVISDHRPVWIYLEE